MTTIRAGARMLRDIFRWRPGRQGTGYRKMLLAESSWLGFDVYLLDYPPGVGIPRHTDPVEGKKHHRINVVLRGSLVAFHVVVPSSGLVQPWMLRSFLGGRVVKFRPDVLEHGVTAGEGRRLVLSIGWVRRC